jgi:dTDP-4-amino-4,6-dideoxygalactose transaminase
MTRPEKIPFADLSIQWRAIQQAAMPDMMQLFDSSAFCLGPFVDRFERSVAEYLDVPHAIGVNSGTSALHLALLAAGIGAGDEVLVPAQTFIATVWGVLYCGATPVFCDVDSEAAVIDLDEAGRKITNRTRAVIPVHLFGQPADMTGVMALAQRYGLTVIEDCAQAIGAKFNGKMVGGLGQSACFSFYPGKNLGAAGEAGLVTTSDDPLAGKMRSLRNHGQSVRYCHDLVGYNYRMEGIQGLVLTHKLPHLDGWTRRRREIAARYDAGLGACPLRLPRIVNGDHVYHLYVIRTEKRDRLRSYLGERNIETGLHYPIAMHRQPCLARYVVAGDLFPQADAWANQCLSLPIFFGMTDHQVDRVIEAICGYFGVSA